MKAYRERTEGVTKWSGQPVFFGDGLIRPSLYASMVRALGFNPTEVSEKREEQWAETKMKGKYDDRRSDIYARFRRWALSGMDPEERDELLEEAQEHNLGKAPGRCR